MLRMTVLLISRLRRSRRSSIGWRLPAVPADASPAPAPAPAGDEVAVEVAVEVAARPPPVLASVPGGRLGEEAAPGFVLSDPGEAPGGVAIGAGDGLAPGAAVVTVASPMAPEPATGGAEVAPAEGRPPVVGAERPPSPLPEAGGGELAAGDGLPAEDGDEIPLGADEEEPPEEPPPDDDPLEPEALNE